MTELPAPLSAPDCYLGGYDFMPLLGTRLFASEFYGLALKNPRAGLAAMKLWWLAYSEQRPAGSLPGSEDDLCRMADLGTDLKAWRAVRSVALHGFVQCSDGRYYHPVICKEAAVAYAARVAERDRKAKWRAKQQAKAAENNEDPNPGPQECPAGQDGDGTGTGRGRNGDGTRMSALTGQDRTGQDSKKEERKEEKKDPEATLPLSAPPPEESSANAILWREGIPILRHLTNKSDAGCRHLLGKMLRDMRDDAPKVLLILQQARSRDPMPDPVAWLTKATQNHGTVPGNRYGREKPSGVAAARVLEEMARGYLTLEAEEQKWPN